MPHYIALDPMSRGDVFSIVSSQGGDRFVKKSVPGVLATSGAPFGIVDDAAGVLEGAEILVPITRPGSQVSPTTSGLAAVAGYGRVSSSGRIERVAGIAVGDYSVGAIDASGVLTWDARTLAAMGTGNATSIQSIAISGTAPAANEGLRYNGTAWAPGPSVATIAGSGQIAVATVAGAATASSTALETINSNLRGTIVDLTDANATLTLAGGRRYRLPNGTLTQPRFKDLSNTGAAEGDTTSILVEQRGHHALVVRNAASVVIANIVTPGLYLFEFRSGEWVSRTPAGIQVFNVKDFGALGDERIANYAVESAAIQAAFDAAAACGVDASRTGAAVYFPPGNYRIDGFPLKLRRTRYGSPLMYFGAGPASVIANDTGVGAAGDALVAESLVDNPDDELGGEQHLFRDLAVRARGYCIRWDFGDDAISGLNDGLRTSMWIDRCYFSRRSTPGPAIRIFMGSRVRITNTVFDVFSDYGVTGVELVRTSGGMINCRGGAGLFRARDGAELFLIGTRCEGGRMVPAYDLLNCKNVYICHVTNEGHDELEAMLRFRRCQGLTLDNVSPAGPDRSYIRSMATVALTGTPTITFSHTDATSNYEAENRIVRSSGSWHENLISYGGRVKITNASTNTAWYTILEATHDTLWVAETVSAETVNSATGSGTTYRADTTILPTLTFASGPKTITRSNGSWDVDGFVDGMVITSDAALNPGPFTIVSHTATALTVSEAVVAEGPVTGKTVFSKKLAGGISLKECFGFQIRNGWNSFRLADSGDFTRYGVEVDADCRDGVIDYSTTSNASDISIDPAAYNVVGQGHGHSITPAARKTFWHGRHRMAGLDLEENQLHLRKDALVVPTGLCGLSIRRDSNGFRGIWYKESANQGWYCAESADEGTIGNYSDFFALRFVGPSTDNCNFVSQITTDNAGFAWHWSPSSLGNELGVRLFRTGTSSFTLNPLRTLRIIPTAGGVEVNPQTYFSVEAGTFAQVFTAGSRRFYADATGLSFFAASAVAQQADTGAITDSSGGTADNTIAAVSGSGADATINNNFADLAAKYNALRTLLRNYGLMA